MFLRYHAGHCCAVKTIEGFWQAPSESVAPLPEYTGPDFVEGSEVQRNLYSKNNYDKYGYPVTSVDRFYWEAAPRETALERLKRYLDFLAKERPSGMVDCYLIDEQVTHWDQTLKELGFKDVARWKNSNSNNYVTCYQLCYGQPEQKKTTKKAAPFTSLVE